MKPANDNSADVTTLKPCDHQAFLEALDCPASPTDALRAAFRKRTAEKDGLQKKQASPTGWTRSVKEIDRG